MKTSLMAPKRLFLFLVTFLFLMGSSFALNVQFSEIVYEEKFEYNTSFVSNGYQIFATYVSPNSPFKGYSDVGYDSVLGDRTDTESAPSNFQILDYNRWSNNTLVEPDDTVIFKFDFYDNDTNVGDPDRFVARLMHNNFNKMRLVYRESGKVWNVENDINTTVGQDCSSSAMNPSDTVHEILLFLDFPNDVYSFYVDGECTGTCCNQILGGTTDELTGIAFRFDAGVQGLNKFVDNVTVGEGTINGSVELGPSAVFCEEFASFCDDFDYNTTLLTTNGWNVYKNDLSPLSSFSPTNNKLFMNATSNELNINHRFDTYKVDFQQDEDTFITHSPVVPLATSEFIFNISSESNEMPSTGDCMHYKAQSKAGHDIYDFAFCRDNNVVSIEYRDSLSDDTSYTQICAECLTLNKEYFTRITTYFNASNHPEIYAFNTTHRDKISLSVTEVGTQTVTTFPDIDFLNPSAPDIRDFTFYMLDDSLSTIDDYVVMGGTSDTEDTMFLFSVELFSNETVVVTNPQFQDPDDLATKINGLWETIGLKTTLSKFIFGLFLLILANLMMFSMSLNHRIPTNIGTHGIVSILLVIILVYLGLVPFWILMLLIIIGAGIFAWAIKHGGIGA